MTDHDHPDTDLTDQHGEAEALRRENERLREELASGSFYKEADIDALMARAEAAEAALAASREPDPVVNAGSCQPGDLISRAAVLAVAERAEIDFADPAWTLEQLRAIPAAPVAEAKPTIGGAELDALVAELRSGVQVGDQYDDMPPTFVFDGAAADAAMLRAAAAITALRAQPDWKAMAERLGEVSARVPSALNSAFGAGIEEREGGSVRRQAKLLDPVDKLRDDVRAALSDLAKMKGE